MRATFLSLFIALNCFNLITIELSSGLLGASQIHGCSIQQNIIKTRPNVIKPDKPIYSRTKSYTSSLLCIWIWLLLYIHVDIINERNQLGFHASFSTTTGDRDCLKGQACCITYVCDKKLGNFKNISINNWWKMK